MFLDDPVGNVEEFIQPVCSRSINSQDQEPASPLEIRDPIQRRDDNVKTAETSQKSHKFRPGTRGHYGRIPEERMARSTATTKPCFRCVAKPMERERLMCRGRGAARSLVSRECRPRPSAGRLVRRADITAATAAYSGVDGNPRACQQ